MVKKPVIGIITVLDDNKVPRVFTNINYPNAVIKAGGVPVMLPVTDREDLLDSYLPICDGFLFSGGIDISPCRYGEMPSRLVGATSLLQDDYQIPLMQKVLRSEKPFLAICRGIQLLNVACGGTLYQDVTEYSDKVGKHVQETDRGDVSHQVSIEPGSALSGLFGPSFMVNSYHHQSLKRVADCLNVTARADDGIVEAVEVKGHPFGLGVQWHPEAMLAVSDSMLPLFKALIEKAAVC